MIIRGKINDESILKTYLKENNSIKDCDYYILKRVLKKRNNKYYAKLDYDEILNINMPHHYFCNSKFRLNWKGFVWKYFAGLTLKKLTLKINKKYKKRYQQCWKKVTVQSSLKKKTTIILCQGKSSVLDLNYFPLTNKKNELYLINGFHRLISIALKKTDIRKYKFIILK